MLVLLYQEGPFTRGIFRRSASARACRELRDLLNSGHDDITLTCESTFVTATVFKDFLRHIPGTLLSQDLYEQWVEVMDQAGEGEEERVQAVQRLVRLLPRENQLLLAHLLAVLYCVQCHAHHNQMNSFNLSVCIAPSMLWAPGPCSPSAENEGTKKVSEVVRFMIEHCSQILGEDIRSLFGGFPERASSSDHGSDVSSFQLNDSSYDSLENELNEDGVSLGSPLQHPRLRRGKQETRSCDSVLTLSDCELDPADPVDPLPIPVCLELPPLARPRKFTPAAPQPGREPQGLERSVPPPPRWQRRCSEPALLAPFSPHSAVSRKASYDALEGDQVFRGEDEQDLGGTSRAAPPPTRRRHKQPPPPLRLDTSLSSLSSPATSPSGSSLSSLDSAFSQGSADHTLNHAHNNYHRVQSSAHNHTDPTPCCSDHTPSYTPPREPKDCSRAQSSAHSDTWLPEGERQQSLWQQDGGEGDREEEEEEEEQRDLSKGSSVGGAKLPPRRRCCSPPSYQQVALKAQRFRSPCCRIRDRSLSTRENKILHAGSDIIIPGHAAPPRALFYGQSTSCVSLAPPTDGFSSRRRCSEPTAVHEGQSPVWGRRRASSTATAWSPQDDGLKVSDVEPKRSPESRFCLSPSATRALRDYFSSAAVSLGSRAGPGASALGRSREVAAALLKNKREWLARRCSDPRFEDFDQMLFGEESYV
ncbi:hypothetical protein AGOR_G00219980 [Albula goreensis]|uniref:Rho-GAP domain-containing protein n=1 Tax=Albula goreensis TaxID=1534307 RepID=A0A8T3CN73_9TELE|nr:hypothetical protein AGOR_G00219980 [Albula goreensis]